MGDVDMDTQIRQRNLRTAFQLWFDLKPDEFTKLIERPAGWSGDRPGSRRSCVADRHRLSAGERYTLQAFRRLCAYLGLTESQALDSGLWKERLPA